MNRLFSKTLPTLARSARAYATEAPSATGSLKLTLALPHQSIFKNVDVQQVNIASTSGDMGILANHVPSIEQLRPGIVEIVRAEGTKKLFLSGGFAIINPDSTLNINALEAFPLDEFSPEAVASGLANAQKTATSGATEAEREAAKVEIEVFEAIQHSLKA
ncbi:MAG: F1 complex, delta/epsilon subunit of ATPase [Piptocephalis tieghemiana]|nr:MAG: F1 complex, delta/epsilon subunit of ATPase [Piptocephalis tieghemiana]